MPAATTPIPLAVPALHRAVSSTGAGTGAAAAPGVSDAQHAAAVEVLRDLLRCAYDPASWEQESALLEERQADDLLECVDRVDQVLSSRIELFTALRDNLVSFRTKLASKQ